MGMNKKMEWKKNIAKKPAMIINIPPINPFLEEITVKIVRTKLGIKCIKRPIYHKGSPKTSKANKLIKRINNIDRIIANLNQKVCLLFFAIRVPTKV